MGNEATVVGLDLAEEMLEASRPLLSREGRSRGFFLVLVQGDAASSPFRSDAFDAIFMSFTLELFDTPEIPAALAECRRMLRPEGRLGVVALSVSEAPVFSRCKRASRAWPARSSRAPRSMHAGT